MSESAPSPQPVALAAETPSQRLYPGSRHALPVRRPSFPFASDIPKHWAKDNAFATHAFNGLNLLFPDGERFFIKSVQDLLPRIEDEALLRQARGFAGQEAMHAREHERYFELLAEQGYRVEGFLRAFRRFSRFMGRWLPASTRIAVTAGAEHWTATFGALVVTETVIREEMHPTMEALIVWHASEEIEHKSVAFDVMQAAGVGHFERIVGFLLATAVLFGWSSVGTRMLLRQDGLSGREIRSLRAKLLARERSEGIPEKVRSAFRAYFRRDFHPNQQDELPQAYAALRSVGLDPVAS